MRREGGLEVAQLRGRGRHHQPPPESDAASRRRSVCTHDSISTVLANKSSASVAGLSVSPARLQSNKCREVKMQQAVFLDAMCSSEPRQCSEWQSNVWGAKFTGSDCVTSVFGLCIT
eukprot:3934697-Rhodomonas_salina.1